MNNDPTVTRGGYLIRPDSPEPRFDPSAPIPSPIQSQYSQGADLPLEAPAAVDDLVARLKKGEPWKVIRPEWLDPPFSARNLDLRNDLPVVLPAAMTAPVNIFTFTVPEKYAAILQKFGHALTIPAAWGSVLWTIQLDENPLEFYRDFLQQIGPYDRPVAFGANTKVLYQTVISVRAQNVGAVAVGAFARLMGWYYPVLDQETGQIRSL